MIKPIIEKKTNFVLGARIKHGIFGMRNFKNNLIKSFVFNCSHILLTFLFNLFYKQKLKDPWTCYKVFKTSNQFILDLRNLSLNHISMKKIYKYFFH